MSLVDNPWVRIKPQKNKTHFNVLAVKHESENLDLIYIFSYLSLLLFYEDPVEYFSRQNDGRDTERIYGLLHLFLVKILVVNQDGRLLRATYITSSGFATDYHRHHKSYSLWCPIDWANNERGRSAISYASKNQSDQSEFNDVPAQSLKS